MLKGLMYCCTMALSPAAKSQDEKVFTSDIDNFWIAYDSMQLTTDSTGQLQFIQTLYVDKGTEGLEGFYEGPQLHPTTMDETREGVPKVLELCSSQHADGKTKVAEIEKSIEKLKTLYPRLKPARMFFTIGGLSSGGTVWGDMVLIGSEIAAADAETDVSQFTNNWLRSVFKEQKLDNIVALNIHEYVHTQQKKSSNHNL